MKKTLKWFFDNKKVLLTTVASVIILLGACFYNLSSITNNKFSMQEAVAIASSSSGDRIWNNPLFLPFKLPEYLLLKSGFSTVFTSRIVSAIFGITLVFLFYSLARLWFSAKIAWLSSLMLLFNGLFLNFNRLAVPDVLLPLGLLGLLWAGWWVFQSKINYLNITFLILIVACSLYIPGLIWFSILVALVQRRHIAKLIKNSSIMPIVGALLVFAVLLSPLVRSFILFPQQFLDWLAIPVNFTFQQFLQNFLYVPASLIIRAPLNPVFNLGHLPYLDVLTICLVAIGAYAFLIRYKLIRTRAMIGSVLITWVLIALNNYIQINLLLPLIYLSVAGGIMFLLQQWYSVFPKNPFARTIGITLLITVISISLYYNTMRYFVAWANNPISQQAFQINPSINLLQ